MSDAGATFLILATFLGIVAALGVARNVYSLATRHQLPPRIDVKAEWAPLEQRRFYAHLLTRRKVGALVVSTLVVASVVGAAVWHNEEGIGDLLQRPESVIWWSFPTWWIVGAVASLVLAPIAAFAILGGKRCPECGGPLENGTTSGDHIVLICTPCGVLWRTGWKVGRASDSIEHHDHHPF